MTTEPLARTARWSAPLLLVPCAAAVFGASVWWAAGTTPASFSSPAPSKTPTTSHLGAAPNGHGALADPRHRAALRRELAQRHHQAGRLQRRLQQLRTRSAHLHISVPTIPQAPAVNPAQPAPAAPPPVNTVTGASG